MDRVASSESIDAQATRSPLTPMTTWAQDDRDVALRPELLAAPDNPD